MPFLLFFWCFQYKTGVLLVSCVLWNLCTFLFDSILWIAWSLLMQVSVYCGLDLECLPEGSRVRGLAFGRWLAPAGATFIDKVLESPKLNVLCGVKVFREEAVTGAVTLPSYSFLLLLPSCHGLYSFSLPKPSPVSFLHLADDGLNLPQTMSQNKPSSLNCGCWVFCQVRKGWLRYNSLILF